MENEEITNTEVTEFDGDFDSGWDEDVPDVAEETESANEPEAETVKPEAEGADQQPTAEENAGEPQNTEETPADEGEKEANQSFTLKHLDDVKTVGREEVITLAQKGMDYDRIRAKSDRYEAFLKELAAASNVPIDEMIKETRAAMLAKNENIDISIARQKIEIQAEREELDKARNEQTAANEANARQQADFAAFVKEYPNINPKDIPENVWKAVRSGESLVSAYGRHEARQLKEENKKLAQQIEALKKNNNNKEKAAGSQRTAGSKDNRPDPFEEGWADD